MIFNRIIEYIARSRGRPITSHHPAFFEGTEMPTAGWWPALWPNPAGVLEAVGLKQMDVIDLCCGDGWFTSAIAKVAHQVIAIDIDRNILDVAWDRLKEAGVTNCEFVEGDVDELTALAPRPVDFVFMANAFHGVCPDRLRLSQAVRQRLKPDGRFVIVNWHQRPREETTVLGEPRGPRTELRMSPQQTIKAVEAGSFKFTKLVELPPYHYTRSFSNARPLESASCHQQAPSST